MQSPGDEWMYRAERIGTMVGRHKTKLEGLLGAVALLATFAGCGGNSTKVGITVTGPTASPVDVLLGNNAQFGATVVGISTTSVFWQICLPATSTTIQPTNCTAPQPITPGAPVPTTPLTGYGTITMTGLYTAPSKVPAQNSFVIMASSTVQPTAFGIITVNLDSGIVVTVTPATATIGPNETYPVLSNSFRFAKHNAVHLERCRRRLQRKVRSAAKWAVPGFPTLAAPIGNHNGDFDGRHFENRNGLHCQ